MPIKNIICQDIQASTVYQIQHIPPGFLKLDAIELPYELPIGMKQELLKKLQQTPLRLYPDINQHPIINKIKRVFKVPDQANIVMSNRSDELIQLLTLLVAQINFKMFSLDPTFTMYQFNSELYGMQYITVNCDSALQINFDQIFTVIEKQKPALIFISYPNNPTGIRFHRHHIQKIITQSDALVVIDEYKCLCLR